jgi:hypothetical protein
MRTVAKTPSGWYERNCAKLTENEQYQLMHGTEEECAEVWSRFKNDSITKLCETAELDNIFENFNLKGELVIANLMLHSKRATVTMKHNGNFYRTEHTW